MKKRTSALAKKRRQAERVALAMMERAKSWDFLVMLNDAVAAEYWKDPTRAGLITSRITYDPPLFYASIVRYGGAYGDGKQVVCKVSHAELDKAVREVGMQWLAKVSVPPREDLLKKLRSCLSDEEQMLVRKASNER